MNCAQKRGRCDETQTAFLNLPKVMVLHRESVANSLPGGLAGHLSAFAGNSMAARARPVPQTPFPSPRGAPAILPARPNVSVAGDPVYRRPPFQAVFPPASPADRGPSGSIILIMRIEDVRPTPPRQASWPASPPLHLGASAKSWDCRPHAWVRRCARRVGNSATPSSPGSQARRTGQQGSHKGRAAQDERDLIQRKVEDREAGHNISQHSTTGTAPRL